MSNLILSVGSLIIGVLATIFVSRYYFRRTIEKNLTPYIQFGSSLFDGVDSSVRELLKISYKGTPVTELLEVQFLIANTGERSIRDVITPLTVTIPDGCTLLDASLLHVSPEGREVSISQTTASVSFEFPILNSNDFFITKLLLQGRANPNDFQFRITVDDLPPTISPVRLTNDMIETGTKREFESSILWIGLLLLFIGSAFIGLIYSLLPLLLYCWDQGIINSFKKNWIPLISTAIAIIPTIVVFVLGHFMIIGAFTNYSFPNRRRFRVPRDFAHDHYRLTGLTGPILFKTDIE